MDPSASRPQENTPSSQNVIHPSVSQHQDRDTVHTENPIETLYTHPNVKIVSFAASGGSSYRRQGHDGGVFEEEPGSLSWSSRLERTIAVGSFTIYRTTGSVAFLKCGSALQPILRKSQCWCVDDMGSKFVLQIRRPQYWRIELPLSTPEEESLSQTFREVLEQILQFEKTHCPFQRPFTVFIPEQIPTIKKPWKPVPRPSIDEPERPTSPTTSDLEGAMSTWYTEHGDSSMLRKSRDSNVVSASNFQLFQNALQFFSDAAGEAPSAQSDEHYSPVHAATTSSRETLINGPGDQIGENLHILKQAINKASSVSTENQLLHKDSSGRSTSKKSRSRRATGFTPIRSGTLPPQLSLVTSPSMTEMAPHDSSNDVSSQESCHNSSSWPSPTTPLPPSPPMSQPDSPSIRPHYPDEAGTSTALTRRKETQKWASRGSLSIVQRAMSSLPDAVLKPQLSQPTQPNLPNARTIRSFPMDMIIKMCQILLGIPSYLVNLMLKVTRRILSGESRGQEVGYSDDGERIPVQWDYSEGGAGDFGISAECQGDPPPHCNKGPTQGSASLDENQIWGVD